MRRTLTFISIFALMISMLAWPATAVEQNEPGSDTFIYEWDGRGTDSQKCGLGSEDDPLRPLDEGWIHWVFATKGASTVATLTIQMDGEPVEGSPFAPGPPENANVWHFYTPYFEFDDLTASITLNAPKGPGGGLVISDYCPGDEDLEVNAVLSGTKFIAGVAPPSAELADWVIEIFDVSIISAIEENGEPDEVVIFTPTPTEPDPVETDQEGEWTATIGPFAEGDALVLAVCEEQKEGYYQVSPKEGDPDTIVHPDDGRVCHLVSFTVGLTSPSILGLDFENARELLVTKTAETSYTRTHDWDIEKRVETQNEEFLNGTPKIWLYIDGTGNETATWTVDTTYKGFEDSHHKVEGDITIVNPAGVDAVITAITDTLTYEWEDGSQEVAPVVPVDCGEGFELPYILPAGETLTCTYDYAFEGAGQAVGSNTVVVESATTVSATADLVWGDPEPELYAEVTITDTNPGFAAKYGAVVLKAEDYDAGDVETFTYTEGFSYAGYEECGSDTILNTATIVELERTATAELKINIQCYRYESAWAKGRDDTVAAPFCSNGFSNWGWTNKLAAPGTYVMDLWAGAGQCDTAKGTRVGTVTVVYDATTHAASATFDVDPELPFEGQAFYAGEGMFPTLRNGRPTTAPGQYTNMGPFEGGEIWTIAHVNVGFPDPDFGPQE